MRKSDLKKKRALQEAVRQVAEEYLRDPNINSVGVGYKMKDGKPTDELALQFTVGRKLAPESLESVATRPIPEAITANGIKFATDVVEREFVQQPVAVAPEVKPERKRRIDPMVPGVSIGHVRSTAGTLGCLVKEAASGDTLVLSNWHVLHGEDGKLGDPVVQPGPYDDNRVTDNVCGTVVRSFLGLAGDCAIATLAGRGATQTILDLGVAVRELGDPELGDRVVKSGRTTNVTYGIVTRIHTITQLEYGSAGAHQIGGFEIGPDDEHPAENEEISMGGDSGSAWMLIRDDGAATEMMLGLHFAGENVEPGEYAVACYASSVFEKLEIDVLGAGEPEVVEGAAAVGYAADFLPGSRVEVPEAASATVSDDYAPTKDGDVIRHYTHFSLAMSASRRFCRWVAWNVDGECLRKNERGDNFVLDPAYAAKYQAGNDIYKNNRLDRGHIARRADLLWGTREEVARADSDSFFYTNIVPQLDDFNQSGMRGLWGELENAIYDGAHVDDLKISVFGGPIFKNTDVPYRTVLVPRSFWKVVAYVEKGKLLAKAFVLTQDDLEAKLESLGLEEFRVYQLRVAELSGLVGLDFGVLRQADTMARGPEALGAPTVRRIEARSEIVAG